MLVGGAGFGSQKASEMSSLSDWTNEVSPPQSAQLHALLQIINISA